MPKGIDPNTRPETPEGAQIFISPLWYRLMIKHGKEVAQYHGGDDWYKSSRSVEELIKRGDM